MKNLDEATTADAVGSPLQQGVMAQREGPMLDDEDGNLPEPIWKCSDGKARCKHFGVHDWHYFYCSAQHNKDNAVPINPTRAYPWAGAGKRLYWAVPDNGCPFLRHNAQAETETTR